MYFHRPAGTSRGILHMKDCWLVKLVREDGSTGWGEVSFIPGLSLEEPGDVEIRLDHICKLISRGEMDPAQPLPSSPGIRFALETALRDLEQGGSGILFPSDFTEGRSGIPTNGLIWMGQKEFMLEQIRSKMEAGFRVLKMKVGALDFQEEVDMLHWIRSAYRNGDLEIRLDANGAWSPEEARERLEVLAAFGIHSIEQPIGPGQPEAMARLCNNPVIPIALDEELTGMAPEEGRRLLQLIRPQYIILKPGLLGGLSEAGAWLSLARELDTGWWVTSALESNIGLNAIAQWTFQLGVAMPQGLGTGQLFRNNILSPLEMKGDRLWYNKKVPWDFTKIQF
ncbi:MAG: o-succinylbenzoate synthase [Bacteroidota bacterium]